MPDFSDAVKFRQDVYKMMCPCILPCYHEQIVPVIKSYWSTRHATGFMIEEFCSAVVTD